MAYEFPKADALQCIPEFNGSKDELEAFLYHVQHFADEIPDNEPQTALIYVVLLKLKGKAAAALPRIRAVTWPAVKRNLIKEFGTVQAIEVVIKQIETLRQEPNEEFNSYKRRASDIKELLDVYEDGGGNSAMEKSLRLHFIGGLRNNHLKQMARGKRNLSLDGLMEFLEEQCEECEQLADIENRMRGLDLLERQQGAQGRRWQSSPPNNNARQRENSNGNRPYQNNFNSQNNNNQRRDNNFRRENYQGANYATNARDNGGRQNFENNERSWRQNSENYPGPPPANRNNRNQNRDSPRYDNYDQNNQRNNNYSRDNQRQNNGWNRNTRGSPPWNGIVNNRASQDWRYEPGYASNREHNNSNNVNGPRAGTSGSNNYHTNSHGYNGGYNQSGQYYNQHQQPKK
ncbi:putative uncharacterized protein DDB_G0286901 [Wyeomyia smithii]|uniref:putative uncharacterized protein DDB_G0286901 n=1 Tax=Wyeomyia smithii TaxID=174621 RepID=UPI002467FE46|nr:putative uncharacterized protein DDB_G0286901 [Wyeomyia smithii]